MTKLLDLINEKKKKEKVVKKKGRDLDDDGDIDSDDYLKAKDIAIKKAKSKKINEYDDFLIKHTNGVRQRAYERGWDDCEKGRSYGATLVKDESEKINENHLSWPPTQDHEATMAKGELRNMIENGAKIYKMIEPNQQLPGWVSAYITLASDYMHSIAEYLTEEEIQYSQNPDGE